MDGATAIVGFDSAWADKAPGAICALVVDAEGAVGFKPPELASFDQALGFVETESLMCDACLIAVDQPTIVPNTMGCRPVDRVTGSLISFIGGGVQTANRSKQGLFDDNAPFWRFKACLGATEDPERSRTAITGRFIIEAFPALALSIFNSAFFGRLRAPKYNPANKRKFRSEDWIDVVETVRRYAQLAGIKGIEKWANEILQIPSLRAAKIGSMQLYAPLSGTNGDGGLVTHRSGRSSFGLYDRTERCGHTGTANEGCREVWCPLRLRYSQASLAAEASASRSHSSMGVVCDRSQSLLASMVPHAASFSGRADVCGGNES